MTESPVYYTTAYEIRIVKTLYAFIVANGIILISFPLNRIQAASLGVIRGYIMGMILLSLSAFQPGPQSFHEVPGIGRDSLLDRKKYLYLYLILA
jgi:hypothetical protein